MSSVCPIQNTLTVPLGLLLSALLAVAGEPDASLLSVYDRMTFDMDPSDYTIHDPSRIISFGDKQMIAVTGKAQEDGYDCGLETWWRNAGDGGAWKPGQCLFRARRKPSWVQEETPANDGAFWAPELDLQDDGTLALLYSVAEMGQDEDRTNSCVGVARSITGLDGFPDQLTWEDATEPLTCVVGADYEEEWSVIDPNVFWGFGANAGKLFLATGGGRIVGTELDPTTYFQKSDDWRSDPGGDDWTELATGPSAGDDYAWVEAAYVHPHPGNGFYYLFVNWGACCRGVDSTYEIRVGRSRRPLGPYYDREGREMTRGGGTPLEIDSCGFAVGPGHAGIAARGEDLVMSFHYYDKRRGGNSWIAEKRLVFRQNWPKTEGKFLSSFRMNPDGSSSSGHSSSADVSSDLSSGSASDSASTSASASSSGHSSDQTHRSGSSHNSGQSSSSSHSSSADSPSDLSSGSASDSASASASASSSGHSSDQTHGSGSSHNSGQSSSSSHSSSADSSSDLSSGSASDSASASASASASSSGHSSDQSHGSDSSRNSGQSSSSSHSSSADSSSDLSSGSASDSASTSASASASASSSGHSSDQTHRSGSSHNSGQSSSSSHSSSADSSSDLSSGSAYTSSSASTSASSSGHSSDQTHGSGSSHSGSASGESSDDSSGSGSGSGSGSSHSGSGSSDNSQGSSGDSSGSGSGSSSDSQPDEPTLPPTTTSPTYAPTTASPTYTPTTASPTYKPTYAPTAYASPTDVPTAAPTTGPSASPSRRDLDNPFV